MCLLLDPLDHVFGQRVGRQGTSAVTRVNTRFFDVLHDACDVDLFTIAKRINVEFDRARKVAVKQHRAVAGHNNRLRNVAFQLGHIAHDFHSAAA